MKGVKGRDCFDWRRGCPWGMPNKLHMNMQNEKSPHFEGILVSDNLICVINIAGKSQVSLHFRSSI